MLIRTPHRIRKIILLSNNPHSLIGVIRKRRFPIQRVPLDKVIAPKLNVDMLALVVVRQLLLRDGDRLAVKVVAQRDARETEDGGHKVCVA